MIKCPIINPIRFHGTFPDYSTSFPNMDNITQRNKYIEGIEATQYYKEWLYGKALDLQFEYEEGDNFALSVYKYNQTTEAYILDSTSAGTIITPAGWIGNGFVNHSFTLDEGTYYLKFSDNYTSDVFTVINALNLKKKLVEIVYTNSENDFGAILEGQTLKQYFTGQLIIGTPENEISAFESDRGELVKLSATPRRNAQLNINELHYTYVDHVNLIFSCDTITINGATYQNDEIPSVEPIEGCDLVNITVKLTQTNNTYKYGR